MKKIIYTILILLLSVTLNAQIRKKVTRIQQSDNITQQESIKVDTIYVDDNEEQNLPDTVYCINTKKQHGWFAPITIVDKTTAQKSGQYYMFTRKNAMGHWTLMEAFNGHGVPTWLGVSPYIMLTADPLGDEDWIEKVKTGCITEMVADPTGKFVVQERQYDKDMNLIYTFSHVPIGDRKYIGSYKDIYGLPAEMRNDTTQVFTYGTLVVITEDIWGNDSVVEYVDAKGLPKNNYDGVGKSIYINNEKGQLIAFGSGNHEGDFVIDNKGNCGWQIKYDERGFVSEKTCVDQFMQPMRMPENYTDNNTSTGVIRILYTNDDYGRCIEEKYVTMDGSPDVNIYGCHRIEYTYDSIYGDQLSVTAYDINSNLAPITESNMARYIMEYDSLGRQTFIEFYDKDNILNSTPGYLCRRKSAYGSDGLCDEEIEWIINDGKEDTAYYYKREKDHRYIRYYDGSYRIDSMDYKGRTILTAFYYADGRPEFNKSYGYHKETTVYTDKGNHVCEIITQSYDTLGNLCGDYPKDRNLFDSITFMEKRFNYDAQDRLVGSFIMQFQDINRDHVLSELDANCFGTVCRAGGVAGVSHYIAEVMFSTKGDFSSFICKDEFNEPDYIKTNSGYIYYYQIMKKNGKNMFCDENSHEIQNFSKFSDDCPKALSIEVTDSLAYMFGIKDNDIILRYGEGYQTNPYVNYMTMKGDWTIAQVFEAPKKKDLLLFRIDPETKQYGVVQITLPEGNPSDLGFLVHIIYRTKKQCDRQQEAISNYCKQCKDYAKPCLWMENMPNENKDKTVLLTYPEMYRTYRFDPYPSMVIDPSIVFALQLPELGLRWQLGQDISIVEDMIYRRKDAIKTPTMELYYMKDGKTIQHESFTERTIRTSFFEYQVTETQYKQLEKQFAQINKTLTAENKKNKKVIISEKQLYGRWQTRIQLEEEIDADIIMDLSKKGSATVEFAFVADGDIGNGMTLKVGMSVMVKPCKWSVGGREFSIVKDNANVEVTIKHLDIIGIEGDKKEAMIAILKENIEKEKDGLLDVFGDGMEIFDKESLYINNVTSKTIDLYDRESNMIFHKVK